MERKALSLVHEKSRLTGSAGPVLSRIHGWRSPDDARSHVAHSFVVTLSLLTERVIPLYFAVFGTVR